MAAIAFLSVFVGPASLIIRNQPESVNRLAGSDTGEQLTNLVLYLGDVLDNQPAVDVLDLPRKCPGILPATMCEHVSQCPDSGFFR